MHREHLKTRPRSSPPTLFGLLAVELAVEMTRAGQGQLTLILSGVFLLLSFVFVYRSFYGMRIGNVHAAK